MNPLRAVYGAGSFPFAQGFGRSTWRGTVIFPPAAGLCLMLVLPAPPPPHLHLLLSRAFLAVVSYQRVPAAPSGKALV